MVEVFGRASSINVQKVMWTIAELNVEHARHDVGGPFGGTDTPEYGAMNPNRLVPVLKDGDVCIWESNAIIRYLSDRYGAGTLSPSDEAQRAQADQWMDWSLTTLYPPVIPGLFWSYIRITAADRDMNSVAANLEKSAKAFGVLDGVLADRAFIVGDQLTMADVAVGSLLFRYFTLAIERPSLPNVERYYDSLTTRPGYQTHIMQDYSAMKVPGA